MCCFRSWRSPRPPGISREIPGTPLRLYAETLGAAYQPVLDGVAAVGIVGSLPIQPASFTAERVTGVAMTMVAAPDYPLALYKGIIPKSELARHVQLVLADRSTLSKGREFGVMSPSTWRLADLFAKHAFLLNGLGWAACPPCRPGGSQGRQAGGVAD